MINITQNRTNKQVGLSSLFVRFSYNENIVNALKSISGGIYDKTEKTWEFPISSLSVLLDVLCEFDDIKLELMKEPKKEETAVELQSKLHFKPYPYQEEGIKFGLTHDKWLLLDACGLGKSIQAISIAEELRELGKIDHCLVVCGINTLKMNWVKEIQKFTSSSVRILGQRYTRKGKIKIGSVNDRLEDLKKPIEEFFIVTNIETLRNNDIVKEINSNKHNLIDMIVVDEIHMMKNPTTEQGGNLLKLNKAKYKIAMTGTMIVNNPLDSYIPLRWIDAEKSTYTTFKGYYCNFSGPANNIISGFKNTKYLKNQIAQCSLRRTKDILDLPPKTVVEEYVDMSDTQREFYDDIEVGVAKDVDKVNINTTNLLSLMARLRQATACPSVLTTKNVPSAKVDRAVDLAEQIISGGDKVVIFSTFKETVRVLGEKLKMYNCVTCTGDDKDEEISERINRFQTDDNTKIFCATWQKCGTGITLTAATYMIFIDTPYTDAVFSQSQDRIYRIGTKSSVTIYNLICKDTVDERVLEIVNDKSAMSDYIIDNIISQKGFESLKKYLLELQDNLSKPPQK